MKPELAILAPGLFSTIQDLGRHGYQRFGIPVSGALDRPSLYAANLLAGNPPDTAALELLQHGPHMIVDADSVRFAYAGGDTRIEALTDNAVTRVWRAGESFCCRRGEAIRIAPLTTSRVGYLAVEGGFAVPEWLGSRSTYTRAGLGGFKGRRLQAGDRLQLCFDRASIRPERRLHLNVSPTNHFRVMLGPQEDYFTPTAIDTLLTASFTVSRFSDRMGVRLEGPQLAHAKGSDIVSDGTAPGSIQVPGNGLPIVLLADRQTTGGYPKIATVISVDVPAFGRLSAGASVTFSAVTIESAQRLRHQYQCDLQNLAQAMTAVDELIGVDPAKLLESNLVSGVVDARNE